MARASALASALASARAARVAHGGGGALLEEEAMHRSHAQLPSGSSDDYES